MNLRAGSKNGKLFHGDLTLLVLAPDGLLHPCGVVRIGLRQLCQQATLQQFVRRGADARHQIARRKRGLPGFRQK